jgi:hypothetical protein
MLSLLKAVAAALGLLKWWSRQVDRRQHRQDGANEAALEAAREADELVRETLKEVDDIDQSEGAIMTDKNNRLRKR